MRVGSPKFESRFQSIRSIQFINTSLERVYMSRDSKRESGKGRLVRIGALQFIYFFKTQFVFVLIFYARLANLSPLCFLLEREGKGKATRHLLQKRTLFFPICIAFVLESLGILRAPLREKRERERERECSNTRSPQL